MAAAAVLPEEPVVQVLQAVPELVPLETYLTTTYRPDREYVEGKVKERSLGEQPHSSVQKFFIRFLAALEEQGNFLVFPEQRVQVSTLKFRVPDVCVVRADVAFEPIVRTPPLVCIEILSKDDRMTEMLERLEDYLQMGVPAVWLVDPRRRKAFQMNAKNDLREAEKLVVPENNIEVPVSEIFRELDLLERRSKELQERSE